MQIDTSSWGWPQWVMLCLLFLSFVVSATQHGKERLETSGERKGKPELYNGFIALARCALWLFLLTYGGFFA